MRIAKEGYNASLLAISVPLPMLPQIVTRDEIGGCVPRHGRSARDRVISTQSSNNIAVMIVSCSFEQILSCSQC